MSGPTSILVLAQAAGSPSSIGPYFLWVGILIILVAAAGLGLLWFRKRAVSSDTGFDPERTMLDELRALRDRGELSPEEFDAARQSLLRKLTGADSPRDTRAPRSGERIARPGFDLTGAPLPPAPPPDGP